MANTHLYAVLVTSLPDDTISIAQHYRNRTDSENVFDEIKNQRGWNGFATHDLKRCRLMPRAVVLIYNWWNIFTRQSVMAASLSTGIGVIMTKVKITGLFF
jgi:hypothetical protein